MGQFLSEDNGRFSLMRLCVLLVVMTVMGVWAHLSVQAGQFVPIPWEQVVLVLGSLGAKVVQKDKEA